MNAKNTKKKRNRQENKRFWVRVLAIVLAVLLVGGTIISILVSMAEEAAPTRDRYVMEMSYLEDEQALHITQRLAFVNRTVEYMDRVLFSAAANVYRRESALPYDEADLLKAFPAGYVPGGMDLVRVEVDGTAAEYGFQGENETTLRVACALAPGQGCEFLFEYYLLLTRNDSLLGKGDTDVRLSSFFPMPGVPMNGGFVLRAPVSFTRSAETTEADYAVTLTLPAEYLACGTGNVRADDAEGGARTWTFEAEGVRDFALSFGRRWREGRDTSESGVTLRVLTNVRGAEKRALVAAGDALRLCEAWLGAFPLDELTVAQSDYAVCPRSFPGVLWISEADIRDDAALKSAIRFFVAQQYIGYAAWTEPVTDAWLSDAPCTYLALLMEEALEGHDAFLKALNAVVLDPLNITVPGGLTVTSDARDMSREEYELITIGRGTVVMHEMASAMGSDAFIAAMRLFYEAGLEKDVLEEADLVRAFDAATGGDWEAYLTEWLFNVDDYLAQRVEWYE